MQSQRKPTAELTLDFDNTVETEDRFAIRHFLEDFVDIVNNQTQEDLDEMFSGAVTAEGFSEFILQKKEILEMFYSKFFGRRRSYIHFSKLKLSFTKFLYHVHGDYEEYSEGILAAAGTIDISLVKTDDGYEFVNIKFYPRMRMPIVNSNIEN